MYLCVCVCVCMRKTFGLFQFWPFFQPAILHIFVSCVYGNFPFLLVYFILSLTNTHSISSFSLYPEQIRHNNNKQTTGKKRLEKAICLKNIQHDSIDLEAKRLICQQIEWHVSFSCDSSQFGSLKFSYVNRW